MSAQIIFDNAPLGSVIRYTDGQPRPPERFRKKLASWKQNNGSGRLIKKMPAMERPTYAMPATFTLHEGDFGANGTIVIVVHRSYSIQSSLKFEIVEPPAPGSVLVLTSFQGIDELRHVAHDMESAKLWLASHHYSGARFETVADLAAATAATDQAA